MRVRLPFYHFTSGYIIASTFIIDIGTTIIGLKKSRTFVSKTSLSSISSVVLGRGGRHKKGNPAGNETAKAESDCNYMRNEEIGKVCI